MKRRRFLGLLGGGAATVGAGKAIHNAVIGYGKLTGTNLTEQDLIAVSSQPFPQPSDISVQSDATVTHTDTEMMVETQSTYKYPYNQETSVSDFPPTLSKSEKERLSATHSDLHDLYTQNFTFKPKSVTNFFETISNQVNPYTVSALRGERYKSVQAETIAEFTGTSPTKTQETVTKLAQELRNQTDYDIPRYLAGSVQDNILFGAVDLREPFRSEVSFNNLVKTDDSIGMFCYEFTWRSIEALHSTPAYAQSLPVFAATVIDDRHKHVYTLIGTVYRTKNGDLKIPLTFVDYTHVVLYDDIHARSVLGEGLNAYNERHRATDIWWELPP